MYEDIHCCYYQKYNIPNLQCYGWFTNKRLISLSNAYKLSYFPIIIYLQELYLSPLRWKIKKLFAILPILRRKNMKLFLEKNFPKLFFKV